MAGFRDRLRLSFNILRNKIPETEYADIVSSYVESAVSSAWRDTNDSVLAPIKTRIAMDCAAVPIRHVYVDENDKFVRIKPGELNDRFRLNANIDQTGRAFIQDVVDTMLNSGAVAIVPVEVTTDPRDTTSYDVLQLRAAPILEWYNKYVKLWLYNEDTGERQEIILPKSYVAIAYNPLANVMNEPNSTLRRLVDKLVLLDIADNKIRSPGLDVILQLPFAVKGDRLKERADRRLMDIKEQLSDSQYGMAYVDATEKITQLNRPVTNVLVDQVQYLTSQLQNQLGLTESVFNGTASEGEMLNYYNRTVEPVLASIVDPMRSAFLTKTAISQNQSIKAFPNLFKMAPIETIAEAADKFTRNEIMSSNEFRQEIGLAPREDPRADELRNKNLNKEADESDVKPAPEGTDTTEED